MKAMIVRLFTSSKGFPAVRYNTEKVGRGEAELLCTRNLEFLNAFTVVRTADLERYFGAVASLNTRSRFDQFHAVLSCPGESIGKAKFLEISEQWLSAMGYAGQPYLVFFHTDTHNRHVHIVSTDVRLDGSKISDSFDRTRAITHLNKICGVDEGASFARDISSLLGYRCSSTGQLRILFNKYGYHFFLYRENFLIRKFGKTLLRINAQELLDRLARSSPDLKRAEQIRTLISHAMHLHSGRPEPLYQCLSEKGWKKITAFRSDLADYLLSSAGLEVCYLFSDRSVTGFTLIDHQRSQLFGGKEIMELSRFTGAAREKHITEAIPHYRR